MWEGGREGGKRERTYIQSHECLLEGSGSRVAAMASFSSSGEYSLSTAGRIDHQDEEENDEKGGMEGGRSAPQSRSRPTLLSICFPALPRPPP